MSEKYGFVYVWYDRWRKMFYIGSHWGTEDDGYICSSDRMRKAYRRRPEDFKRRIIVKVYDRSNLLDEEFKWLSFISDNELGKKYYNLEKRKFGHWSTDDRKLKSVGAKIAASPLRKQRISEANKGRKPSPKNREALMKVMVGRVQSKEEKEKRSRSMSGKNWKVKISDNMGRHWVGKKLSKKHKEKISQSNIGNIQSQETRDKISNTRKKLGLGFSEEAIRKSSETLRVLNKKKKKCSKCGLIGSGPIMHRFHFDKCAKYKKEDLEF